MDTINWHELGAMGSILVACFSFFYLFLKSYLEQRAKNYADKKDIADITNKVEEVRSQYAKTLAVINANLSLASKGIETFESEQFKSYIAFHQACSYILNDISNIDVHAFRIKLDFALSVENQLELVKGSAQPLRRAKANHDLFNDNENIKEKAGNLYASCMRYSSTLYDLISMASFAQTSRKHILDLKKSMNEKNQPYEMENIAELDKESKADVIKTKDDVIKYIVGEEFQKALKLNTEYELLLRDHLKGQRIKMLSSHRGI
jgi:hypothetical protein